MVSAGCFGVLLAAMGFVVLFVVCKLNTVMIVITHSNPTYLYLFIYNKVSRTSDRIECVQRGHWNRWPHLR